MERDWYREKRRNDEFVENRKLEEVRPTPKRKPQVRPTPKPVQKPTQKPQVRPVQREPEMSRGEYLVAFGVVFVLGLFAVTYLVGY